MSKRYIIEGEWSGYRSGQQRISHRTVHKASEKKLRAWVKKTYSIRYTDGTVLILSARDCLPRERVKEIKGYSELIKDCFYADVDSVAALHRPKKLNPVQDTYGQSVCVSDGCFGLGE